jgi:phage terminase small subunit
MPHSRASLTILPGGGGRRVLEPPSDFGEGSIERAIFVETVMSVPDGHLAPEDRVLLAAYCRASALARRASEELATSAVAGSMPSPWLAVHASAVRSMALLSTRLRLGPRSRTNNTRKAKVMASSVSYYDTHPGEPVTAPASTEGDAWTRR